MIHETPLIRMRPEVRELLHSRFSSEPSDCVYVSTPITSGRAYFMHLSSGIIPDAARRETLRALNVERALLVVNRAQRHFLGRRVVEPASLEEPSGWNQDDFHALWMGFIAEHVATIVMVNGWEYSTGCLWELVEALDSGAQVLDENFRILRPTEIAGHASQSSIVVNESRWSDAYAVLLERLRLVAP